LRSNNAWVIALIPNTWFAATAKVARKKLKGAATTLAAIVTPEPVNQELSAREPVQTIGKKLTFPTMFAPLLNRLTCFVHGGCLYFPVFF
jgi:hypothetical protein